MTRQSNTDDSRAADGLAVEQLEYIGAEDISHAGDDEPDVVGFFECPEPDCDGVITEWCDCPECLWYDGEVWERTMNSPLSVVPDA